MSKEFLGDREQALEGAYFHDQELRLRERLRAKMDRETHKKALAANSGITDDAVLEHLVSVNIHAGSLAALTIVPLLAVGWADGKLDDRERDALLAAAVEHGLTRGSEGWMLLELWLESRPDSELIDAWKDYIRCVAQALDVPAREALKNELMARARRVAEASGGVLGLASISPGERTVLDDLDSAFEGV